MSRGVVVVEGADVRGVLEALRAALFAEGPAVFPREPGAGAPAPGAVGERVALVVETSGSTERPKRVALSAEALLASAAATDAALDGPGRWLLALPVHYIAGIQVLVRSLAAGTEPVVLADFDPAAFSAAAARLGTAAPRYVSLVPAQLARLVEEAPASLACFDRILVGGQATPPGLLARAAGLGARITRSYGSSETAGGCVYDGRPIGGTRVRIADGLVELSGATLAEGYLDNPERTAAAFIEDSAGRWYRTGDRGELADGLLHVTGRADDVIISGGVKVALGEVERAVRTVQGLESAVAVGVPSRWGESVAIVLAGTDAAGDAAALVAHALEPLGPAARPARVLVLDALPHLASGKPDRRAIAAIAAGLRRPHG